MKNIQNTNFQSSISAYFNTSSPEHKEILDI